MSKKVSEDHSIYAPYSPCEASTQRQDARGRLTSNLTQCDSSCALKVILPKTSHCVASTPITQFSLWEDDVKE